MLFRSELSKERYRIRDFKERVDKAALKNQAKASGYAGPMEEDSVMALDPMGTYRRKISDHMEATGNKAPYDVPSAQNEVLKETNRKNMLEARDKDALNARNKKRGELAISRERYDMKKGGLVKSSASKRADGIATKGKTKGRMI